MSIEQTIEIPVSHRLMIEVPREVPAGRAIVRFMPESQGESSCTAALALRLAQEKAANPDRKPLSRHFGTHKGIFGGVDPVAYQRNIRDEWD